MIILDNIWAVLKFIFLYTNPAYYLSKLDEGVAKKTKNLSGKGKIILARIYLSFYLPVTFLVMWLTYTELLSVVDTLFNVTVNSCVNGLGDCFSDNHVSFVKQYSFKIDTFIQVLFLMVGVVVGNIGWDNGSKIKKFGFNVLFKSMSAPTFVVLISLLISLVLNGYLPENFTLTDTYVYRCVGWIIFFIVFLVSRAIYMARNAT